MSVMYDLTAESRLIRHLCVPPLRSSWKTSARPRSRITNRCPHRQIRRYRKLQSPARSEPQSADGFQEAEGHADAAPSEVRRSARAIKTGLNLIMTSGKPLGGVLLFYFLWSANDKKSNSSRFLFEPEPETERRDVTPLAHYRRKM